MRTRTLLLLGIFAIATHAQTLRLRNDAAGPRLTVTDWVVATPVQITFDSTHTLALGDTIYCQGIQNNVQINGFRKVKSILSPTSISLMDTTNVDVIGYTGTKIDVDPITPGSQLGYCGKVSAHTLTAHPRTIWPIDPALRSRLFGPAGPGSGTSSLATDDPARYANLIAIANSRSTATCDGITPSACSYEEGRIVALDDSVQQADYAILEALAWAVTGSTRYQNSARYYINNLHRLGLQGSFTACDDSAKFCGQGEANDFAALRAANWAFAYSLLRSQLTTEERTALAKKLFNDDTSGCTNQLPSLTGELTMNSGSPVVTGTGFLTQFTAGDKIYIKSLNGRFKINDGTLVNVVVSGTTATLNLGRATNTFAGGNYTISGSGIAGLDGTYTNTSNGTAVTSIPLAGITGVANGTYTTAGMQIYKYHSADSVGQWFQVASVDSNTQMTLNRNSGYSVTNAPYGKVQPWTSTTCGMIAFTSSHSDLPAYNDGQRKFYSAGAYSSSATTISINPGWINNLRGIQTPFNVEAGNETMIVTAIDFTGNTITVLRGQRGTPALAATTTSMPMFYRRFSHAPSTFASDTTAMLGIAPNNLMLTREAAFINAGLGLAGDAPEAIAWVEKAWNHYFDFVLPHQRSFWTGLTPGGATSGYHLGRHADFTTQITLSLLNSVSPSIDIRGGFQRRIMYWPVYAHTPYANSPAKPYKIMYADSGNSRELESDDLKWLWAGNYLYRGTEEQKWAHFWADDIVKFGTNMTSSWLIETLPYALAYTTSSTPKQDYRTTAPRSHIFQEVDNGTLGYKAFSSRTSFTDPNATFVWALALDRTEDHLGPYNLPGAYQILKKAELICPGVKGCASGTNALTQAGIKVQQPGSITIGGAPQGTSAITVVLNERAPAGGTWVQLASDNASAALPAGIVISAGRNKATVNAIGYQNPTAQTAAITATSSNTRNAYLTVNALSGTISPTIAAIASLTPTASSIDAGNPILATIALEAPAPTGGVTVNLASDNINITVPASIRVRAGQTTVQFYISTKPSASPQTATITATSSGTPVSASVTANPALPVAGIIAAIQTGLDDVGGGLLGTTSLIGMTQSKIAGDFAYVRIDGTNAYRADRAVTKSYRDLLHINPTSGQDYLIVYDRMTNARTGIEKVMMIPYYRGNSDSSDEKVNSSPADTQIRTGSTVTFTKSVQQTMVTSKILLPASSQLYDNFAEITPSDYGAFVYASGGQQNDAEFLVIHRPVGAVTDMPPSMTELSTISSDFRGVSIADATQPWTAIFAKDPTISHTTLSYTTGHSGNAVQIVTGLDAGTYNVLKDGSPLASGQCADESGTLRFASTAGAISVTRTGTGTCAAHLEILTSSLPPATLGVPYSQTLSAQNGTAPYTWSISGGALPDGLTLSTSGIIAGTPTVSGTSSVVIRVTDAASQTATQNFLINTQNTVSDLSIVTTALPNGVDEQPYSFTLTGDGGTPPYTWSVVDGQLPDGLTLSSSGTIEGTPNTPGDETVTIQVADAVSNHVTAQFQIRIDPAAQGIFFIQKSLAAARQLEVNYGGTSLDANQTCTLTLSRNAEFTDIVETATDTGGTKERKKLFGIDTLLDAARTYHARATCGALSATKPVSTLAAGFSTNKLAKLTFNRTGLVGVADVLIQYGTGPVLDQSVILPCSPAFCSGSISIPSDKIVRLQRIFRNGSGHTIGSGSLVTLVAP